MARKGHVEPIKPLNAKIEYAIKANSFLSASDPKPGMMGFGDGGIEFRTNAGSGYIQIPWENVKLVRAQVYMKKHVRGFFIDTDDGRSFNFVASDAIPALRVMRDHLGSAKLVKAKTLTGETSKKLSAFKKRIVAKFSKKDKA